MAAVGLPLEHDRIIDALLVDLPPWVDLPPLLHPHLEQDPITDGLLAVLPPGLELLPHLDEQGGEDLPLNGPVVDIAHHPPLPVCGSGPILQEYLIPTRVPSDWPVYFGMNYLDLEEESQEDETDEDVKEMEEDEEMKEEETINEGSTKHPISTTDCPISITKGPKCSTSEPSLQDMINSDAGGGELYIPTIIFQDQEFTSALEPRQ